VIGPAAYAQAYGHIWGDAAAYTAQLETFGAAAFAEWMAGEDRLCWLATADGAPAGFATLRLESPDPVRGAPGGAELARLYLLGPARGRGLGRALFDAACAAAARGGARHLWLDAMVSAPWAWRAYERWGMRRIGPQRFDRPVLEEHRAMLVLAIDL